MDLLKSVNLDQDYVSGTWKRAGNAITGGSKGFFALPAMVEGGYDLQVKFTRHSGKDSVNFILPVGS